MTDEKDNLPAVKKKGRPKKEKLPVGRPKGEASIMKDYRMRMLRSPKSRKVLDSIFEVAMDPEHKHWPAASKMVMDRIAPSVSFTEALSGTNTRPSVHVTISGVPGVNINANEAVDGEFEPVDD